MSGRPSQAVTLAARLVIQRGRSIADAAKQHGVAVSSVRRALAREGVPARPVGRPPKVDD